jgi:Glycosyltransferase family 87
VSIPSNLDASTARGGANPFARYRLVGHAFALIILAAAAWEIIANVRHPADRDFLSFWGAAQMAFAGTPALAYDNAALHALQATVATFGGSGEMPFPYPPAYLLLIMPFGVLPFPAAMAAWSLCTLAFYLFAVRRLIPQSGWLALAFPVVFANAAIGQNGLLTAGIFMLGTALLEGRPFAAGLVLGCLVLKPQLALLVPIALLAGRQWKAIAGAAISASAVLLVGLAAFGLATTEAWIHQLPLYARIGRDGLVGWSKLASVYAAARQAGLDAAPALVLHGLVAVAAAVGVWRVWRSKAAAAAKIAILSAAAPLVSPYVFYYDGLILVPAFFWLAREKLHPAVLLALWCLPLLSIALLDAIQPFNFGPVAPMALTSLVYWRWHRNNVAYEQRAERRNLTPEQPSAVTLS